MKLGLKVPRWLIGIFGLVGLGVGAFLIYDRIPIKRTSIPPAERQALSTLPFQVQSFQSAAMGQVRQYGVLLPPGYAENRTQRYPVIFLLHGGHDDLRAYVDKYGLALVLHNLYDRHQLPPSIIITPDGNDRRGTSYLWDPQYYDGPHGNVDRLIGVEVVNHVKAHYRTLPAPDFWAMGGISSGGWGAFNIGLRHLNTFGTLFSQSGYFTDDSGAANSPAAFIHTLPRSSYQHLGAYMDAGSNPMDGDMRASSQQFHETLNKLKIPNAYYVFPGGHGLSGPNVGWNFFRKHLTDSLGYVGERFIQAEAKLTR